MRQPAGNPTPLLLGVIAALSALTPSAAPAAEAEDRALAASCTGCHIDAITANGIPNIASQTAQQLKTTLLAYKQERRHGTLMNRIARGYSDDELARIAAVLGSTPEQ